MKVFYTATIRVSLERDVPEIQLRQSRRTQVIKEDIDKKIKERLNLKFAEGTKSKVKIKSLAYVQER